MLRVLFFLTLSCVPLASWAAEIISAAPDQSALTIYRATEAGSFDLSDPEATAEGLALVTETREINLPAGDSTITFVGVAQTIVPQSARIESLQGDISEINFDYRLISPGDIIADSIGQKVKVIRTQTKTGKITEVDAILVSGPDGILLNINGHLEALDCSGENEKIIFAQIPENLKEKPQLSVQVKAASAGIRKIKLSYLATGFDWVTHYVARINPDNKTLNLTAWLTLVNQQTTSFLHAPVELVAGNISRDEDTEAVETVTASKTKACWYNRSAIAINILQHFVPPPSFDFVPEGALEEIVLTGMRQSIAEASELGEYKLYKLPTATDLNAHQIKQVRMLEEKNISFERLYELEFNEEDFAENYDKESADDSAVSHVVSATTIIRLENKKSNGLGKALPSGDFTVFEKPLEKEPTIFIGEDSIKDTPVATPFDIALGVAEDIDIQPNVMREYSKKRGDDKLELADIQFIVTNHKAEPIAFELKPAIHLYEGTRILKESKKHFMKDGVPVWRLQIPAGKQSILRYTIEKID
ncbi:MAG: hypothetical protein V4732_10385 [Pseudomonadota bacterium]